MDLRQAFISLFVAAICGAIIGSDRVYKRRPAGIKTHSLVAVGACLAMITGEYIMVEHGSSQDVSRLAAQVISGIGFLGAGTIMVTGQKQVIGLTTAAGLWFAGTLGISAGGGYFDLVAMAMAIWAFIFVVLSRLDNTLSRLHAEVKLYVEVNDPRSLMDVLVELDRYDFNVIKREVLNKDETLWIIYSSMSTTQHEPDFKELFKDVDGLEKIEILLD